MAEFAYSFNDSLVVKDYEADAAYTPKKGDFVVVNGSGKIVKLVALTGTTVTGMVEGGEFTGLAEGNQYAATNASSTADASKKKIVKVRVGKEVVYRIPKGDATVVGSAVGIDANGAANVGATAKPFKVVEIEGAYAFVQIA